MSGFNLFNNEQRSGYEELVSYYPIFYRDVREMDAILHICGHMLDGMASAMEAIVLNRFIETMDEEATARMETFLYLTGNRSRPLEERKKLIFGLLLGTGKMSAGKIKDMIRIFTQVPVDIDFSKEFLNIIFYINDIQTEIVTVQFINDIKNLLSKKLPAHLMICYEYMAKINFNTSLYFSCIRSEYVKISISPDRSNRFLQGDISLKIGIPTSVCIRVQY